MRLILFSSSNLPSILSRSFVVFLLVVAIKSPIFALDLTPPKKSSFLSSYEHFPYQEHPQYKKLSKLFKYYQSQKNDIKVKPFKLHPKSSPSDLSSLAQRLIQHGFLAEGMNPSFQEIVEGLKDFQESRGLEKSGKLSQETLRLLNRPMAHIISLIKPNLARWGRMKEFEPNHLIVNIPQFQLSFFKNQQECFSSPTIVGKVSSKTPQFNGYIKEIVTHPTWYIPPRLSSSLSGNAGSRGYGWSGGQLVQFPGPHNALGPIKFITEGGGNILFHSTPKKHLFKEKYRAHSLGCIRVQKAIDLAKQILDKEDLNKKVEKYIQKGKTRHLHLEKKFPVHVLYLTVWVNEKGQPQFFKDIYRYDRLAKDDEDDEDDED